jgi:hypothetical protein
MLVARFIWGAFPAEVDAGSAQETRPLEIFDCTLTRFAALAGRTQSRFERAP